MKKLKKSIIIFIAILLVPAILAGCKPKTPADQSAKILFDFAVKGQNNLSKIGASEKDFKDGQKAEKDAFSTSLKSALKASGYTISDDQVNKVYASLMNSLKKVDETTSLVSEDSKTAEVKITTNYIDIKSIASKAEEEAIDETKGSGITDESEFLNKFMNSYLDDMSKELDNAKPSTAKNEKTFKFVIKNGQWLPEDMSDFYEQVGYLAYQI